MTKILSTILAMLLLPAIALGDPVELRSALREAVKARPFAKAAAEEAGAAEAAVGEARSRYLPRLTLTENLIWTDEPAGSVFISLNHEELVLDPTADAYNFPPSRKDFETRLTLEQPLFDPDISYGLKRAQKGAEAARADARWSAEQAAFAAFAAYLEVQRARGALKWAESAKEEATETVRLATRRREAGIGLKADELRARVSLSAAQRRLLSVRNNLSLARRTLALTLGRAQDETEIAAPLAPEIFAGEIPGGPLARADLEALTLKAREAELAVRQSRAAYLPRLGMAASYGLHDEAPFGTDVGSWSLRAGLSWELFDGLRRSGTTERTAALRRAVEQRRLEATRQALLRRDEAILRAEEARLQLESARQALTEAEESLRLLQERFAAGLSDLSDLLAAQAALDQARADQVDAETRLILALGNVRLQNGTFLKTFFPDEELLP